MNKYLEVFSCPSGKGSEISRFAKFPIVMLTCELMSQSFEIGGRQTDQVSFNSAA